MRTTGARAARPLALALALAVAAAATSILPAPAAAEGRGPTAHLAPAAADVASVWLDDDDDDDDDRSPFDDGRGRGGFGDSRTGSGTADLAHVVSAVGADRLHRAGITGDGVGVALIDTGVAPVAGLDDLLYGPDVSFESQSDELRHLDGFGHGTHLASIITAGSGRTGAGRGVAPDADLVSLKVATHDGAVDVTQVIAAINWVVEHADELGIRVLNLSYGTDGLQDWQVDPLAFAVEAAWRAGIVVVAAAGNDGAAHPSLRNPAYNPWVLAVGAADTKGTASERDDVLADYSSVGSATRRPDLLAPGSAIVAHGAIGSYLYETYPSARQPGGMMRGSGSSQAAAVVSGAVALLLQQHPHLTPDQVKAVLTRNARPVTGGPGTGAGTVRLGGGTTAMATALRSSLGARLVGPTAQTHALGTGTGSIQAARGTYVLTDDGVDLVGEIDIFGQSWDPARWTADTLAATTWHGGTWNGRQWAGDTWAGRQWLGRQWLGSSWAGRQWAGRQWLGRQWAGGSWVGRQWAASEAAFGNLLPDPVTAPIEELVEGTPLPGLGAPLPGLGAPLPGLGSPLPGLGGGPLPAPAQSAAPAPTPQLPLPVTVPTAPVTTAPVTTAPVTTPPVATPTVPTAPVTTPPVTTPAVPTAPTQIPAPSAPITTPAPSAPAQVTVPDAPTTAPAPAAPAEQAQSPVGALLDLLFG